MSKVASPILTISFNFPDPPDSLPLAENCTPRFFHQHVVQGVLRVDVAATQLCDVVKIILQGRVLSRISRGPSEHGIMSMTSASFQGRKYTFLELTDVHRLNHVASLKKSLSYQTPFCFEIPTASDSQHDFLLANQYGLPPSLKVSSSPYARSDESVSASVDVSYELKAYVYQDNILVSRGSQPIQLYSFVSSIPPPISLDDFLDEYAMTRSRTLKKLFSRSKLLEITLSEPKPFVLLTDGQSRLHCIPISCHLVGSTQDVPLLCATITWRLKSISTVSMQEIPTSRQIMLCPFLAEVIGRSPIKSTDLELTDWVVCFDTTNGTSWKKVDNLWLTICQPKDAVPSFFTAAVTRRYTLEILIKMKEDGKAQFDFAIPIQFVWMEAPKPCSMSSLPSTTVQADQHCPMYAR